jgi:hypothetical protein
MSDLCEDDPRPNPMVIPLLVSKLAFYAKVLLKTINVNADKIMYRKVELITTGFRFGTKT